MFSKGKSDTDVARSKTDARHQVPSIISASLRIMGNLVSDGDVQVDGVVDGDVRSRSLTISEGAAVNGAIEADNVRIHGMVNGQISARSVMLGASARVIGDVIHTDLVVESGAFLEGHCRHLAAAPVAAVETPAAESETVSSEAVPEATAA